MKRLFILLLLFSLHSVLYGQEKPVTIILLRHAEKENDGTKDPVLSANGKAFAEKLARLLVETKIDAVYSTIYKRTQETVLPLARQNQLKVTSYDAKNSAGLLPGILLPGIRTVVVAGHSNTVDQIFNSVMKEQPIKALEETEYNKVFIITYDKKDPARSTYVKLDFN